MDDIEDKKGYVTHDDLEMKVDEIKLEIKGVDERITRIDESHSRNLNSLQKMFGLLQSTFDSVDNNMRELAKEQKITNENFTHMTIKSSEQEFRIKRTEDRIEELSLQAGKQKGVNLEKVKVIAYVIFILVAMLLSILGLDAIPAFPF